VRETTDQDERTAIELSQSLIRDADFVISLAAPGLPWIDLPRAADLLVYSKVDEPSAADCAVRAKADLCVSGKSGEGLDALREIVREHLVPKSDRTSERPWAFERSLLPKPLPASQTTLSASADCPHPFSER